MTVPTSLLELETPCLVADRSRIFANAERMRQRVAAHGVSLRPHLKTAKSAAIAAMAHGGRKGPVTVSTLREAEYFLDNGFQDISYAVAITPNKFARAVRLADAGADLKLLVADQGIARALAKFARDSGARLKVMLEIDSGEHRTGFLPDAAALITAARHVSSSANLDLQGVLTHGGHSYRCHSSAEIAAVAEQERRSLLAAKDRLAEHGIEISVLSSGSTPTAVHGRNYEGITELRPGVYLAGDLFQAQLGCCTLDDIAVSVLATVITHDRDRNRLVIDAGGLALSKDRSTRNSPIDYGYGLLTRADGSRFDRDMIVAGVHQEHGEVHCDAPNAIKGLEPGSCVRVLPNHVCMTAASYDRYYVVAGNSTEIVEIWDKVSGW